MGLFDGEAGELEDAAELLLEHVLEADERAGNNARERVRAQVKADDAWRRASLRRLERLQRGRESGEVDDESEEPISEALERLRDEAERLDGTCDELAALREWLESRL